MKIQLKRKHISFVASTFLMLNMDRNMPMLLHLKERLIGKKSEDLVDIEITGNMLLEAFSKLGDLSEREATAMNSEMKEMLQAQLIALYQSGESAAGLVLQRMQEIDAAKNELIANTIAIADEWFDR